MVYNINQFKFVSYKDLRVAIARLQRKRTGKLMKTEDTPLSPQQSLDLISTMIRQAQGNISSASFYFLLWGWVIAFCNLGMYYFLKFTTYPAHYVALVWTLAIPAWIVTMIYASKQDKSRVVITHLDKISMWLWIGLGFTILPAWIFGAKTNWMVNAIILMPVGLATFVSGVILKFRPLIFGGITFWIAGILCYLVHPIDQYLVGCFAMIFGYIVPGYLLRNIKSDQDHV